jgi:hypothetical protein
MFINCMYVCMCREGVSKVLQKPDNKASMQPDMFMWSKLGDKVCLTSKVETAPGVINRLPLSLIWHRVP